MPKCSENQDNCALQNLFSSEVYQDSEQLVPPVAITERFREEVIPEQMFKISKPSLGLGDNCSPSTLGQRQKAYPEPPNKLQVHSVALSQILIFLKFNKMLEGHTETFPPVLQNSCSQLSVLLEINVFFFSILRPNV